MKRLLVVVMAVAAFPVVSRSGEYACDPKTAPNPRYDYNGYIRWCKETCKGEIYNDNTTSIGCRPGRGSATSTSRGSETGSWQQLGEAADAMKAAQGGAYVPGMEGIGWMLDSMWKDASDRKQARALAEESRKRQEEERRQEEMRRREQEREESYRRISGVIKGVESSGELRLKGMGDGGTLKLKTGNNAFGIAGNPSAPTMDTDRRMTLALKTGPAAEPGVAVEEMKPILPVEEAEKLVAKGETELEERKRALFEADKIIALLDNRLKELKSRKPPLEAPRLEEKTKPDLSPAEASDDDAEKEAERLLQEAQNLRLETVQEISEGEKAVNEARDELKRSRAAEEEKKKAQAAKERK